MLLKISSACLLVVVTVAIHAVGFHMLLRVILRSHALDKSGFRPVVRFVIGLTCWLLLIHLTEMAAWGLFYSWKGFMPDPGTGFYFSALTYNGLGDGNLALPMQWRTFAPLEAATGTLMYGLSTGLFFAIVSRWISHWMQKQTALQSHSEAPKNG